MTIVHKITPKQFKEFDPNTATCSLMWAAMHNEWIATLRSGAFARDEGGSLLYNPETGGYDPCGILRALYNRFDARERVRAPVRRGEIEVISTSLTDAQLSEYGLSARDAERIYAMHDDGCSFDTIADWIEERVDVGIVTYADEAFVEPSESSKQAGRTEAGRPLDIDLSEGGGWGNSWEQRSETSISQFMDRWRSSKQRSVPTVFKL